MRLSIVARPCAVHQNYIGIGFTITIIAIFRWAIVNITPLDFYISDFLLSSMTPPTSVFPDVSIGVVILRLENVETFDVARDPRTRAPKGGIRMHTLHIYLLLLARTYARTHAHTWSK